MQRFRRSIGPSVVYPRWLTVCREGFSAPARRRATSIPAVVCEERATKREPKRTAALRVAPKMPQGFVPRSSQTTAGMLVARRLAGAENPSRQTVSHLGYTTLGKLFNAPDGGGLMGHPILACGQPLRNPVGIILRDLPGDAEGTGGIHRLLDWEGRVAQVLVCAL